MEDTPAFSEEVNRLIAEMNERAARGELCAIKHNPLRLEPIRGEPISKNDLLIKSLVTKINRTHGQSVKEEDVRVEAVGGRTYFRFPAPGLPSGWLSASIDTFMLYDYGVNTFNEAKEWLWDQVQFHVFSRVFEKPKPIKIDEAMCRRLEQDFKRNRGPLMVMDPAPSPFPWVIVNIEEIDGVKRPVWGNTTTAEITLENPYGELGAK